MSSPSSPDQPTPNPSEIEDAAITWLIEREDGLSPAREREFKQWLRSDPRHHAAIDRLQRSIGILRESPQFRADLNTEFDRKVPILPFPGSPTRPSGRNSPSWPRILRWAGLAAAIAVGATVGWQWLQTPPASHYATTAAGYARARLDDGSTLELNAASSVRVQFTDDERRVELKTGEAHFAVTHDTTRPFIVSAGGVSVRAVGTAFNVRLAADGAVEVVVTEGKVRVGQGGPTSSATANAPLVAAGERLVLLTRAPAAVVERVPADTLRSALSWQSKLADFTDAPLAAVVERFNARSRVQLIIVDAELGSRPIGGTFALDEAEAFARLLARDGEIIIERRGSSEILLKRAR